MSRKSGSAGGQGANALSEFPSISGSGNDIAFDTRATNLGGTPVGLEKIYVYDRAAHRAELVSRRP